MTDMVWTLDASDGELHLRTGVTGRAARMGHRLTIAMTRWQATVTWDGAEPVAAELVVETDSFEVLRGEGGVKGVVRTGEGGGALERVEVAGRRALSRDPLHRRRYRQNRGRVSPQRDTADPREVAKARNRLRTDDLGDSWRMSAESTVRQSDYGIKPFSLLMGSVQVVDEVTVSFTAVRRKIKAVVRVTVGAGYVLEHPGRTRVGRRSPVSERVAVLWRARSARRRRLHLRHGLYRLPGRRRRRGWRRDSCFDGWCRGVHRVLRRSGSVVGTNCRPTASDNDVTKVIAPAANTVTAPA